MLTLRTINIASLEAFTSDDVVAAAKHFDSMPFEKRPRKSQGNQRLELFEAEAVAKHISETGGAGFTDIQRKSGLLFSSVFESLNHGTATQVNVEEVFQNPSPLPPSKIPVANIPTDATYGSVNARDYIRDYITTGSEVTLTQLRNALSVADSDQKECVSGVLADYFGDKKAAATSNTLPAYANAARGLSVSVARTQSGYYDVSGKPDADESVSSIVTGTTDAVIVNAPAGTKILAAVRGSDGGLYPNYGVFRQWSGSYNYEKVFEVPASGELKLDFQTEVMEQRIRKNVRGGPFNLGVKGSIRNVPLKTMGAEWAKTTRDLRLVFIEPTPAAAVPSIIDAVIIKLPNSTPKTKKVSPA